MNNIYALMFFFFAFVSTQEKRFEIEKFGFSFEEPESWYRKNENAFLENIEKHNWDDKQWEKIKESHKGSINVISFYKYKTNEYAGVIPTINVTMTQNPTKNIEQLKVLVNNSHNQFKNMFEDFKVTSSLKEVIVDGKKGLTCSSSYILTSKGVKVKLNLRTLYITHRNTLFTINAIDPAGQEDNAAVFEKLAQSIKLK